MKKKIALIAIIFLVTTVAASASTVVSYINSDGFVKYLEEKKPVYMVDIQKRNNYLQHHFYGALPTNAYPVRSREDKVRLKKIIAEIKKNNQLVVIIGPRGTYASKRAYRFLIQQGIDSQRLVILQKGIRGWPAPEWLLNTSGQ